MTSRPGAYAGIKHTKETEKRMLPDSVFWPLWWLSWILPPLSLVVMGFSMGKRRELMRGKQRSVLRFFVRCLLVLVLFFASGVLLTAAEAIVWFELLGLPEPIPGQAGHPFFQVHAAAVMGLTALGHKLTRGWFSGPALSHPASSPSPDSPPKIGYRKGAVWLFLIVAIVLGATAYRALDLLGPTSELPPASVSESPEPVPESLAEAARPTQETAAHSRTPRTGRSIENLTDIVSKGLAEIMFVNGNGSSTGAALDAFLVNRTQQERRFSVQLDEPLFLRNQGAGQNMLITRVLAEHGRYWQSSEDGAFVRIEAGTELVPIVLWGYCVDFDKENPVGMEELQVENLPAHLQDIAELISEFEQLMEGEDEDFTMKVAQIALWKAQGITDASIRARFPHEAEHAEIAHLLLEE